MLLLLFALLASIRIAGAATTPSMTVYTHGSGMAKRTFTLSRVGSLSFGDSTTSVRKAPRSELGIRVRGMGAQSMFTVSGMPGTDAMVSIVDLQGRTMWSGAVRLNETGTGSIVAGGVSGRGMLVGRVSNAGRTMVRTLPLIGGAP